MTPEDNLKAIAELAQAAAVGWAQYESTAAALAASTIPPQGGSDRRSSDVSDPVHNIVVSHERFNETAAEITEALGILRDVQARMAGVRKQHPETARAVDAALKAARCDGSVYESCANLAVRAGKCWRCIRREQRAKGRDDAAEAS